MKNQSPTPPLLFAIAALPLIFSFALAQKNPVDAAARVGDLFDQGQTAHERNEFEKAVSLYTEALKIDPDFWQAEYQRALAWRSMRRDDEAQRGLVRTIGLLAD